MMQSYFAVIMPPSLFDSYLSSFAIFIKRFLRNPSTKIAVRVCHVVARNVHVTKQSNHGCRFSWIDLVVPQF